LKQNFCKVGDIAQIIWQIISLFILIARGVNMFLLLVFVKVLRTNLCRWPSKIRERISREFLSIRTSGLLFG